MSTYRQIHCRMWSSDNWFIELKPEFKLLFIYLFSNERASMCGLYELPIRIMSFESGLDRETITLGLEIFNKADKVKYDFEAGVVWVKNALKYQSQTNPSEKVRTRIIADIKSVPDCALKRECVDTLSIPYIDGVDTTVSVSSSVSVSDSSRGGGSGEGTATTVSDFEDNSARDAERLYTQITGQVTFPPAWDHKYIGSLATMLYDHFERDVEKAAQSGKPVFARYCKTRGKNGREYSRTGSGWVDWWLAELAPKPAEPKQADGPEVEALRARARKEILGANAG